METSKSLKQYRQEVQELCQKLITVAQNVIDSEKEQELNLHQLATSCKSYAEYVKKVCEPDKYDLCFIGKTGIGKTTFISFLLDLFDREKLISSKQLKDCCLLKTEVMETTLCKTQIFLNAEKSKFVITGATIDTFKGNLFSFVDYVCTNTSENDFLISAEKVRAIGNILGISEEANTRKDIQSEIQKLLGLQFSSDSLDKNEIVEKLFEKSDYKERIANGYIVEYEYDNSENLSFSEWLQTRSKAINDCTLKDFPFPDEINLYLANEDLNIILPDYIASISDTRGMRDRDEARAEIDNAMRSFNSLQVFCTSVGDNKHNPEIREFLEKYLKHKTKGEFTPKYRTFVCVLEKGDEIVYTSKANSRSREAGISILTDQIQAYYGCNDFKDSNILFQDTAPIVEVHNTSGKISSVKDDFETILVEERKRFFTAIENSLCDMFFMYQNELEKRIEELQIERSRQVRENAFVMFRRAYDLVKGYKTKLADRKSKLSYAIRDIILKESHHSSLWSAINYRGVRLIYWYISTCGESIFEDECKSFCSKIEGALRVIFEEQNSDYSIYLNSTLGMMEKLYSDCLKACGTFYYNTAEKCLYSDDKLWGYLYHLWGNTIPGQQSYTSKVANYLQDYICQNGLKDELVSRNFSEEFFDALLDYLEPQKQDISLLN